MRIQINEQARTRIEDFSKQRNFPSTGVLAIKCLQCGREMYGQWKIPAKVKLGKTYPDYESIGCPSVEKEIDSFTKMKKCPFCGGEVWAYTKCDGFNRYKRGEVYVDWLGRHSNKLNLQFYSLNDSIELLDKDTINSKIENLIKLYDVSVTVSVNSSINEIKNSPEQLQTYIQQLIHLESNIYALKERLPALYYRQIQINRTLVFESTQPSPFEDKKEDIEADLTKAKTNVTYAEEDLHSAEDVLSHAKAELLEIETNHIKIDYPQKPEEPQYETAGFFNKKRILSENAEKKQRYEQALKEYESKLSECEQQRIKYSPETKREEVKKAEEDVLNAKTKLSIVTEELKKAEKIYGERITELEKLEAENSHVLSPSGLLNESIEKEIQEAEQLLKKLYLARNELYAYNIVFIKYRDIVALSTFYEYLMSGRCTSLEGADGAYNIYEAEIRANMIISQLSVVIEKLEEIKQGQYMLYSELQTANASLSSLNEKMDNAVKSIESIETNTSKIIENTELIAYNTEATAYYSKKNAELTDALGFMMAFK